LGIAQESRGIGETKEGTEGQPHDVIGFRKIGFA
jgi:hypothetical protein